MPKIQKILLLITLFFLQYQKQRPNVERVAACIRQHHPQYSNETVHQVSVEIKVYFKYVIVKSFWVQQTPPSVTPLHLNTRLCKTRPAPTGQDCKWIALVL